MTTSAPSTSPAPAPGSTHPLFIVLRIFAYVVLVSILAAIAYAGWISIENWNAIGV